MNRWLICLLILGIFVIGMKLYDLVKQGMQFSTLKRRQEIVFIILYSLLIANVCLQQHHSIWFDLTDVLMLGFIGYWFFLRYLNTKAKHETMPHDETTQ